MKTDKAYITLLLIAALALHSCKKYKVENDLHLPGVDYQLSGKLLCIDPSAELTSTKDELQEGIYNFTYSGIDVPYIQPDKIIVGEQNNGFLRKVSEVISRSDTEISLRTVQASMTDAFLAGSEMLELDYNTVSASFNQDTLAQGNGYKLIATSGNLDYKPDINMEYLIADSALNQMIVSMDGNFNIAMQTKLIAGGLNKIDEQAFLIKEETFQQTIRVAIGEKQVPILVSTDVKIMGYLSSDDGTSNDTTAINWDWSFIQNLSYTFSDNTWSANPSKITNGGASIVQRTSFGNSHYQIKFVPEVKVQIYNVDAFSFDQQLALDYDFTTDNADNWCNTLDADLALSYTAQPQIIEAGLASHEGTDTGDPYTIWQAPVLMEVQGDNTVSGGPGDLINDLKVKVFDTEGLGVAGAKIYYEILMGGGTIGSTTALSNANGIATNSWTLGTSPQPQMLLAYWKKNGGAPQDSVTFVANPPPCEMEADLTEIVSVTCFGGSTASLVAATVGGIQPFQYLWNDGSTNDTISNLPAGTYTVTISDFFSCSVVESIVVGQADELVVSLASSENPVCTNNGMINISVSGGTVAGVYNYNWSNGETTEDINQLMGGTYIVTVTDDNLCEKILEVTLLDLSGLSLALNQTDLSCFGVNDGEISSTVNGGTSPYDFAWSNGQTTEDLSGLEAGQYTLTITDANNCETSETITIDEPTELTLIGALTNLLCGDSDDGAITITANGGTTPYSFMWDNGSTGDTRTDLAAGTYSLTVTDGNGCTKTYSATLIAPPTLTASVTLAGDLTCANSDDGEIDLTVAGGTVPYAFMWNDGETDEDRMLLAAGMYTVTITDANDCTIEKIAIINEPDLIVIEESIVGINCYDGDEGAIDITVSGGGGTYVYQWDNGETTEDLDYIIAGAYEVTVTDLNNCSATKTIILSQPAILMANGSDDVMIDSLTSTTIMVNPSGGVMPYAFDWDNGLDDSQNSHLVSPLESTTYSVTIVDANGCTDVTSMTVSLNP